MNKIKHLFKQTFIKRYLFVNMRPYDNKWEVVKLIPDPRYTYDKTWKGGRNAKGRIIKPMAWITHYVYDNRDDAMIKGNEMVAAVEK